MRLALLVAGREVRLALRRPLVWIYLGLALLLNTLYYHAKVQFGGEVVSGGLGEEDRVHLNGPYLLMLWHLVVSFGLCTLFAAFGTASAMVRDRELRVDTVLRGTHLSGRQYLWGKLWGCTGWIITGLILAAGVGYLNDVLVSTSGSGGGSEDARLFGLSDWRFHAAAFATALPWLVFVIGLSFWLGLRTGSTLFSFLVVMVGFGIANFLPAVEFASLDRACQDWLGMDWKIVRGWIDPSGFSWLIANYGSEDRGVAFYNTVIPRPDLGFALQRLVLLALGFALAFRGVRGATRSRDGALSAAGEGFRPTPELPAGPPVLVEPPGARKPIGVWGVMRSELRLLSRQLAVWAFGLWTWLMAAVPALTLQPGAWGAEVHVTSSSAALAIVDSATLWLCGLTAFLAVEVLHREKVTQFRDIFYASPVRSGAVLWGKVAAVAVVISLLVASTVALVAALQPVLHDTPLSVGTYVWTVGGLLLPGLALFLALGSLCAVCCGSRLSAYGALLLLCIPYVIGLVTGWLDWRGVVVPSSFVQASDITGLSPYAEELALNRAWVLALGLLLLLTTARAFRRTDRSLAACFRWRELRRQRGGLVLAAGSLLLVAHAQFQLSKLQDQGPQAKWREDRADDYARLNRVKWGGPDAATPEYRHLDLQVELFPDQRRFELVGTFTFVNRTERSFPVMPLTVGPDWDISTEGDIQLVAEDGSHTPAEVNDRGGLYEVRLARDLEPGEECRLHLGYGGRVEAGARRQGGAFSHWILPEAVFLDSFGPNFLPVPGYVEPETMNEDVFDERSTPQEMARMFEGRRRALFGGHGAFDVELEVTVPEGLTALSAGIRRGEEDLGDGRRTFRYRTDHPVYFFPIMAGKYELVERGECKVFHDRLHPQNVQTIADALDRSRRFYSSIYSPYPYRELRIVEFPALAGFAMGHPTLIPFSEGIGFLTKGDDGVSNINFMVTAHEVAHQWWGTVVTPARAPGAPFLTEALAHFSTLLMEERFQGRVSCRNRRREWERLYVEARRVDVERAVVRIDGSEPGDQATWYNKGGWVFWMLSEHMGRERFLEALRSFIAEYSFQEDHPTIHDLLRHVRVAGGASLQPFLEQWFYETDLPAPRIRGAVVTGSPESGFTTRVRVENVGQGSASLTVEVAERRARSTEIAGTPEPVRMAADQLQDALGWVSELEQAQDPDDPYRFARQVLELPEQGEVEVLIETEFRPRWVVLDPDVQLLMSGRNLVRQEVR